MNRNLYLFLLLNFSAILSAMELNVPVRLGSEWETSRLGKNGIRIVADAPLLTPHQKETYQKIFNGLEAEPFRLLKECQVIRNLCEKEATTSINYASRNPIYLLGECAEAGLCEQEPFCSSRRNSDTTICPRKSAIDLITTHIAPAMSTIEDPVVLFYAPGHLFFELEVLLHLAKNNAKTHKIILVDPYLASIISGFRQAGTQRISPSRLITRNVDKLVQRTFGALDQFLKAVSVMNDDKKPIEIYFYAHMGEYVADAKRNNDIRPNFSIAMDYLTPKNSSSRAGFDFIVLLDPLKRRGITAQFSGGMELLLFKTDELSATDSQGIARAVKKANKSKADIRDKLCEHFIDLPQAVTIIHSKIPRMPDN